MDVQPFIGMPVIPPARPIRRIPNDGFPTDPYGSQEYFLCFATLVFTGIHVAGWNFTFPSYLEQVLWRVSSLTLFGVTAAFWVLETMASWKRLGRWAWLFLKVTNPKRLPEFEKARDERLGNGQPRELVTLPLPWEFWTIMPVAVLYGLARCLKGRPVLPRLHLHQTRRVGCPAFIATPRGVRRPSLLQCPLRRDSETK